MKVLNSFQIGPVGILPASVIIKVLFVYAVLRKTFPVIIHIFKIVGIIRIDVV